MSIIRTYQFKLKPTKKQIERFERWLGVCRMIYNMALEIKIEWYNKRGINISKNELCKQLTDIRREYDWVKDVQVHTQQDVIDRLFMAYDSFFRRIKNIKNGKNQKAGFPKFAKKNKYCSFGFKTTEAKVHTNTNTVQLAKIGKVKFRNSRKIEGEIRHTRIIKKADGWYVSIITRIDVKKLPTPEPKNEYIANDLGLIHLIVDSNGYKIPVPKYYRNNEKKLNILQRALHRKNIGSSNWKKAKDKLARQHKIISDSRKDFLHKISSIQVSENQVIGFEDLNIAGMVRNNYLSKSILDAGWGILIDMTRYKAVWYGRTMIKLNRFYPSSKTCSTCGYIIDKIPLGIRKWTCPECKTIHDRDENSAKNLASELKMTVGHTVSTLESRKGNNIAPLATS